MQGADSGGDGREQYRVVISHEANAGLEDVVGKVNSGFDAGVVTKSDVANFVFLNLSRLVSDVDIRAIRALHFDDKKMLGSILRNEDDLPNDLKRAVRAYFGVAEREKRKSVKSQSEATPVAESSVS